MLDFGFFSIIWRNTSHFIYILYISMILNYFSNRYLSSGESIAIYPSPYLLEFDRYHRGVNPKTKFWIRLVFLEDICTANAIFEINMLNTAGKIICTFYSSPVHKGTCLRCMDRHISCGLFLYSEVETSREKNSGCIWNYKVKLFKLHAPF